jgi:glycosyltransferase involved in cell wall biosynthesis
MTAQSGPSAVSNRRVLLIQFSGDYREGYNRLASGGEETYHSQRYSVEETAEIGRKFGAVGVLCCCCEKPYDEVMGDGVRAMGAGLSPQDFQLGRVTAKIEAFGPTHVVLKFPLTDAMSWALDRGVEILPCLADSFTLSTIGLSPIRALARTVKHHFRSRRLAKLSNSPRVRWVANHNVAACRDLARIGIDPRKIVPWDVVHATTPEMYEPRPGPVAGSPWRLLFVGGITEQKGVGDAIEAVAELKRRGRDVEFRLIGKGDIDHFLRQARTAGVADQVHFEGLQPNSHVVSAMRASDLVVIPSRHVYSEAQPFVFYEAFATRTPVLCSDHPMFKGNVREDAARFVPEQRPLAYAYAVEAILSDHELYRRMSIATLDAWHHFQCPVKLHELLYHWIGGSPDDERWLAERSLASGRYPV